MMRMRNQLKYTYFFVLLLLGVLISVLKMPITSLAATPRLMISDYEVSTGSVVGGKEFDLQLTLKNTASKNTVKNIKVTVSTENGEFLPVDGAGTAYVETINATEEEKIKIKLKAIKGLQEKSYKVKIKTEYESNSGYEYTVEEAIFLPVTMEQRVAVTELLTQGADARIGDTVEITAKINNMGEGSLYNVMATVKGDGVDEMSTFIGNVESGKSGSVDIITLASEVTNEASQTYLYITYEDIEGNKQELEQKVSLAITSPIYDDLVMIKGDEKKSIDWTVVKWLVGTIVVVGIVAFLIIRRARRKRKLLEEF
ncbi:MAG: hypothetical protein E7264_08315 [Lachnospiraceae bacterium]|nr:hypothetical protein [Lachnospiraceae bacterium]